MLLSTLVQDQSGKSAYEVAVDNGFSGTELEWLDSLKGDTGAQGPAGPAGAAGAPGATGPAGTTTVAGLSDATATGKSLLQATDPAAARSAIGAGTSNLAVGADAGDAKAGNWTPTAADISDATTVGRNVLKATDAAAARDAIGAVARGANDDTIRGVKNGALVEIPAGGGIAGSDGNYYLAFDQTSGQLNVYLDGELAWYLDGTGWHAADGSPSEPPEDFAMLIGFNTGRMETYSGALWYANLMYHIELIGADTVADATATITSWSNTGYTMNASTNITKFKLMTNNSAIILPSGTYTVRNPNGIEHRITNGGGSGTFTTSTSYTFTEPGKSDSNGLFIQFKGSHDFSDFDGLEIIIPDHVESYDGGNIWNQKYINFHKNLKTKVLRFMDATNTNLNCETDWSERALPRAGRGVAFNSWGNHPMPWEDMCDLAGRIGCDVWVCVPTRATQNYVESMAQVFADHLPAGRKVWVEHSNETWNSSFGYACNWIPYNTFTKNVVSVTGGSDTITMANHGFSDGKRLVFFKKLGAIPLGDPGYSYPFYQGYDVALRNTTTNTFEVWSYDYSNSTWGAKRTVPAKATELYWVDHDEAGKVKSSNAQHMALSKQDWDAFDLKMGHERCVHVMATQFTTSSISGRLADSDVKAATDYVARAPYFAAHVCGAKLSRTNGAINVGWYNNTSVPVHLGVYASGSTPSASDVMAGIGTGFVSHFYEAAPAVTPEDWGALTNITGLTNGVTYDFHFVYTHLGATFHIVGSVVPSASAPDPDTDAVVVTDSYAQQSLKLRLYINNRLGTNSGPYFAIADTIPVANYEGGLEDYSKKPAELTSWFDAYRESADFAQALIYDQKRNCAEGIKMFAHYGDVLSNSGQDWSIANGYQDTNDERYKAFKALGGGIAALTAPNAGTINVDDVGTEPGSYPFDVFTFPNDELTYTIVGGNESGFYQISGDKLQLLGTNDYDFGVPTQRTLKIEATAANGLSTFVTLQFFTGDAWYPATAKWVIDTFVDTDPTDGLTPVIGPVMSRVVDDTYSPTQTVSGNMWYLKATRYSGDIQDSYFDATVPTLLAIAVSSMDTYSNAIGIGSSNNAFNIGRAGSATVIRVVVGAGLFSSGSAISLSFSANPSSVGIYWGYWDGAGNLTIGLNQDVVDTTYSALVASPVFLRLGTYGSKSNTYQTVGCAQFHQESGMDITRVKALVAKMQAKHGIA